MSAPILEVQNLVKQYVLQLGFLGSAKSAVHAVQDVSFSLKAGEILCIVGESGCGKSTLARLLMRIVEPTDGRIILDGTDITRLGKKEMRQWRRKMQMVFQDPFSSLNPRLTAAQIVTEPVENFTRLSRSQRRELAKELFGKVGLRSDMVDRLPSQFSGGQRQRLGIARALSLNPSIIIADEAVSALDVSVQAQILNLILDLQQDLGIAFVFISHDLGVVAHIGNRVAVMYLGRIVELADCEALFSRPVHPYTEALIASAPIPDPRHARLDVPVEGEVPSAIDPPSGCAFHPRCGLAVNRCRAEVPALVVLNDGRSVACHVRSPAESVRFAC